MAPHCGIRDAKGGGGGWGFNVRGMGLVLNKPQRTHGASNKRTLGSLREALVALSSKGCGVDCPVKLASAITVLTAKSRPPTLPHQNFNP